MLVNFSFSFCDNTGNNISSLQVEMPVMPTRKGQYVCLENLDDPDVPDTFISSFAYAFNKSKIAVDNIGRIDNRGPITNYKASVLSALDNMIWRITDIYYTPAGLTINLEY
mgnify:CR=1 FL=1